MTCVCFRHICKWPQMKISCVPPCSHQEEPNVLVSKSDLKTGHTKTLTHPLIRAVLSIGSVFGVWHFPTNFNKKKSP